MNDAANGQMSSAEESEDNSNFRPISNMGFLMAKQKSLRLLKRERSELMLLRIQSVRSMLSPPSSLNRNISTDLSTTPSLIEGASFESNQDVDISLNAKASDERGDHNIFNESSSLLAVPEGGREEKTKEEEKFTISSTTKFFAEILFGKFVSIFLVLIPVAIVSHHYKWSPVYVFWFNFLVMVPLAAILGDFTEELALHTNDTVGGLINATFGNAVEVVISIQALYANEIRVVQASMLGSIFSNLLLVLGMCFFVGGMYHKEQSFNATSATANVGLLAMSGIALVLPGQFGEYYDIDNEKVLLISRISAVILIFVYLQMLYFQLVTHTHLFDDTGIEENYEPASDTENGKKTESQKEKKPEEEEHAQISFNVAAAGLFIATALVTFFSENLVSSIDGFVETTGINKTFVGLIILPIVGNAVEHITAVSMAAKNKMDLAMGVAVGSSTQISLFVMPLTVLIGWGMGKNMTMNFPKFEILLYVLSVVFVAILLSHPKGNWLEGSLLMMTYVLIAIGIWFEKVKDY